jgi:5-aminolevulinate synthase
MPVFSLHTRFLILASQVHAVGLYGPRGAGVAEHLDFEAHQHAQGSAAVKGTAMDRVDIITGLYSGFVSHI